MDKSKLGQPSRALSKDYTVEYSDEIESMLSKELGKAIQAELANQIAGSFLREQGWYTIMLDASWSDVDPDWLDDNVVGTYRCFGHYWYFDLETDAIAFGLRWG